MRICILAGRRTLDLVFARTGSGERFSLSASVTSYFSWNWSSRTKGEGGRGVVSAAAGKGAYLKGGSRSCSFISRNVCMLENRRGNWKSMCEVSIEFKGASLDFRCGGGGASSEGEGRLPGDRGGMSIIDGLICCTILKDDSVGV